MVRIEQNAEPIPGYRLIQRIGSGGFGEVWKAEAPGGIHKAIKIIHGHLISSKENDEGIRHAEQELKALKRIQSIRHPYLLSLERYDIVDNRLFIVMELADCNLWDRYREYRARKMPGIPRPELMRYLVESAEVLDMMFEKHQLQHLDVKPQNLFLLYNHVKVADFGLVKELEGMQAAVTGGVTPVYAAPETLKGIVTPFCDQYSLAIVYQELLTGFRPFEGVNAQQLVLMHTHGTPNLSPLPPGERSIVAKALAKTPEQRFGSCMEFVNALQGHRGEMEAGRRAVAAAPFEHSLASHTRESPPEFTETPNGRVPQRNTDVLDDNLYVAPREAAIAPPEIQGEGVLRPAVIVGLGKTGLTVLRKFRKLLFENYGPPSNMGHIRLLYIDTDPEQMAKLAEQSQYPLLLNDEIVNAKLNRSSYYVKPRRNGRAIIDGWFDKQLLYKLPRVPQTQGLRAFGRLAFVDHYRTIADKLEGFLRETSHPDTLGRSDKLTRLGVGTNRPRVYIVAGLGGGTGGGMFLDAAETARLKLTQLGLNESEVVGYFLLPRVDTDESKAQPVANAYASLRELNHYTREPATFSALYDERDAVTAPSRPPYDRAFCFPYQYGDEESQVALNRYTGQGIDAVADLLFKDLFSSLGRMADRSRGRASGKQDSEPGIHICEKAAFTWPRGLVLQTVCDWMSVTAISRWIEKDTGVFQDKVRMWIGDRWNMQRLSLEHLVEQLDAEAAAALGSHPDAMVEHELMPLQSKGWFSRDPEPAVVWQALAKLRLAFGGPDDARVSSNFSVAESAIRRKGDELFRATPEAIVKVASSLMDEPGFRLGGALAANELMRTTLEPLVHQLDARRADLEHRALDAFRLLTQAASADKGRTKSAQLIEAGRVFAKCRVQSTSLNVAANIYRKASELLASQGVELAFCRKQVADLLERLRENARKPMEDAEGLLLPYGARTLAEACEIFKASITPDDLDRLDERMQAKIEYQFTHAMDLAKKNKQAEATLQDIVEEQARAFVKEKLDQVDFSLVFTERFADPETVSDAIRSLHELAEPPLRGYAPDATEICILGMPASLHGTVIPTLDGILAEAGEVSFVESNDEVYVYREVCEIPIRCLPQVGPLAEDAYISQLHAGAEPHCRSDIANWADVESYPEYANGM